MPWLSARKTVSLCIALEAALSSDESIINRLNKNVTKTCPSLNYLIKINFIYDYSISILIRTNIAPQIH